MKCVHDVDCPKLVLNQQYLFERPKQSGTTAQANETYGRGGTQAGGTAKHINTKCTGPKRQQQR